ncbi:aminotransferase, partial [Patescibacteria group bacterium]|nr:aminotransferase [Patescibacteria group bacterium]
ALKSDWSRDRIMTALMAEGIPCGSGSCSEIYLEKAFDQDALRPKERLPVARQLGETSLMFMVHPTLSADDMEDMVRSMDKVMRASVRC